MDRYETIKKDLENKIKSKQEELRNNFMKHRKYTRQDQQTAIALKEAQTSYHFFTLGYRLANEEIKTT